MKKLFTLIVAAFFGCPLFATTWYVNGTSGADGYSGKSSSLAKKTIQAAIDAASSGDTILVAAGTYASIVTGNKVLSVKSQMGPKDTIIDGRGTQRCAKLIEFSEWDWNVAAEDLPCGSTLDGFTLVNGYAEGNAGVEGGTVKNCIITGNYGWDDAAGGGFAHFHNCLIRDNRTTNWGGGPSGAAIRHSTAYNCTIVRNTSEGGGGAVSHNSKLVNCIVAENYDGEGRLDNVYSESDEPILVNCYIATSGFVDPDNGDYRLAAGSPCVDAGDNSYVTSERDLDGNARVVNGRVDIGCYEYDAGTTVRTWYVNGTSGSDSYSGTSFEQAKRSIQAAIDVASDGDTILVAAGTYMPIMTGGKALIVKSLTGAKDTIIDGQGIQRCAKLIEFSEWDWNVAAEDLPCGSTLDGFTLVNGYAEGNAGVEGGTVKNCIITGNYGWDDAAGGGFAHFHNCLIWNNRTMNGGGGPSGAAIRHSTAYNCTIVRNTSEGGGGAVSHNSKLVNCIVAENYDGEGELDNVYSESDEPTLLSCCVVSPGFVNPAKGDYRLEAGSPCIDAGDNAYVTSATDMDGNARVVNRRVDIGCYEFSGGGVQEKSDGSLDDFDYEYTSETDIMPIIYRGSGGDCPVLLLPNGGSGSARVTYVSYPTWSMAAYRLSLPRCPFSRSGYAFDGWAVTDGCLTYRQRRLMPGDVIEVGCSVMLVVMWRQTSSGPTLTLADALNVPGRTIQTGGDDGWFAQTSVSHDGSSAARSGGIGDDEWSWMETTVAGPAEVSFWWKVSSENYYDKLTFAVDDEEHEVISGSVDWQQVRATIPAGSHTIGWYYEKDYSGTVGDDCGWVDQLAIVSYTTCKVTFNAYGGSCSTSSKSYRSGATYGTLPTPTRVGYVFNGWYTAKSGGSKISSTSKVTGTRTLYARWSKESALKVPTPKATQGKYSTYVKVTWTQVSGAKGYHIYRGTSSSFSKAKRLCSTSSALKAKNDKTVQPGTKYYYWVCPYSASGKMYSSSSKKARGWAKKPTIKSPTASDGKYSGYVKITIPKVSGATEYRIYRSTSSSWSKAKQIATTSELTYKDTTATAGKKYYYWFKAKVNGYWFGSSSKYDSGYMKKAASTLTVSFSSEGVRTHTNSDGSIQKEGVDVSNSSVDVYVGICNEADLDYVLKYNGRVVEPDDFEISGLPTGFNCYQSDGRIGFGVPYPYARTSLGMVYLGSATVTFKYNGKSVKAVPFRIYDNGSCGW